MQASSNRAILKKKTQEYNESLEQMASYISDRQLVLQKYEFRHLMATHVALPEATTFCF